MKRSLTNILIFGCIVATIGYVAFTFRNNSGKDRSDPQQQFLTARQNVMLADGEYTLLAIKYGLEPATAKDILVDYDSVLYGVGALDSAREDVVFPEATNTAEVVTALSNKYKIPSATIASLLIDREAMQLPESEPEPAEPEYEPEDPY